MICTIKDKTEQRKLEETAENERSYVSMMLSVLQDPFSFLDFIEEQSELIQSCLEDLRKKNEKWKSYTHRETITKNNKKKEKHTSYEVIFWKE